MHTMPSPSLPTEIILIIVNDVSSLQDLRNLRTAGRAFCAAATPRAFRTVGATNRRDNALGLVSLLKSDLANYVREVVYREYAVDELPEDRDSRETVDADYGPAVEKPLVEAFTLAASLPWLRSLRFMFHPRCPAALQHAQDRSAFLAFGSTSTALHLQRALLATIGGAAPHLRALALTNVMPLPHAVYELPTFQTALSSLTNLLISTASGMPRRGIGGATWFMFWLFTINRSILNSAVDVMSLSLMSSDHLIIVRSIADGAALPRLKYLTLRNVRMIGEADLEEFVRRHGMLEWIDGFRGTEKVRWVRRTHADPLDKSEYEFPPSMAG
ncbi:hypothetical protein FA95DRAFT_1613258 [Auriscalpium vulgare]|uniref:Uncharacterized protein n=1 Tax=Auriscalpium vulgare TaxID=40419 RepID=A0ACB8R3Y5_9AGAM|nr:hypothetical protein FA95DRAFT_1613258 [Auriscalpium vulgare]